MLKKISSLGIIITLLFLAGCIENPSSPLSSIPAILIDHVQETKETKIYVHGIHDTLFENITIHLDNETISENFTYALHTSTTKSQFILNVTAWFELKEFEYNGNFTLLESDNEIALEIIDDRHEDPIERSLPYTIIMERK